MRVAIREQLAILVLFLVLLALCVVSVPTWIYVDHFVRNVEKDGLTLTASLKASRITSELELIQTSCLTISSRILIQAALTEFYEKGHTSWDAATTDFSSALSVGTYTGLLQARLFSRNDTGGSTQGLLNVTSPTVPEIVLPYSYPNGSSVQLGDPDLGYPPTLYPNITYVDLGYANPVRPDTNATAAEPYPGVIISRNGGLLLGPLVMNETTALISVSVPIRDNNDTFILGYMTVVALASTIIEVRDSPEGLGETGVLLLVGPTNPSNRFNATLTASNTTYTPNRTAFGEVPVEFVLPPGEPLKGSGRHGDRELGGSLYDKPFQIKSYPAVLDAFAGHYDSSNNASSLLNTHNEQGAKVAVGFARTETPLVNWTVVVEKARSEAYQPIYTLRDILLGTVFGTAGFIILVIFPIAHLSVMPITRLKVATVNSMNPPGYDDSSIDTDPEEDVSGSGSQTSKKGFVTTIVRLIRGRPIRRTSERDVARQMFKIPGKVEVRKHLITDELTELTSTFNDMSDELVKQYLSLDEKVAERTKELEESKKAAEAANESKTLFIANISHELKTPLNGILGMCAVSMEETDLSRIKGSLKTLYKSGDLLLHLLEDLLSFSKNQIGHQLSLELKEFRLSEIRSQILAIFDKQVREGQIGFSVDFVGTMGEVEFQLNPEQAEQETKLPALGPLGTGRLKDMCLWGDQHRILQVIINLVSNSLKFTPAGGRVDVRIKCTGIDESADEENISRSTSLTKKASSTSRRGRTRNRVSSNSSSSGSSAVGGSRTRYQGGTALSINPMNPQVTPHIMVRERSATPPPPGAKSYFFEFEVQDTGPGIPDHMQQKVFEPFVQGDIGLSRKYGGTGLGLSICHQLAKLMGGSITLRSTVGVGTTFTMCIPLKYIKDRASSTASSGDSSRAPSIDATNNDTTRVSLHPAGPAAEAQAASVLDQQPRLVGLSQPFFASQVAVGTKDSASTTLVDDQQPKLRVLVADDNNTNIEVVSRMLKLEDVSDVTVAKDGQEAYDVVKATMQNNQAFDVIFMDVQMPNVDGLESTRLIREMGYTSPIVALTAFSEESNVRKCMDSGMNEFLSKPIRRPALKQLLKKFATIPEEPETSTSPRLNGSKRHSISEKPVASPTNGSADPEKTLTTHFENGLKDTSDHHQKIG